MTENNMPEFGDILSALGSAKESNSSLEEASKLAGEILSLVLTDTLNSGEGEPNLNLCSLSKDIHTIRLLIDIAKG